MIVAVLRCGVQSLKRVLATPESRNEDLGFGVSGFLLGFWLAFLGFSVRKVLFTGVVRIRSNGNANGNWSIRSRYGTQAHPQCFFKPPLNHPRHKP